MEEIKNYIDSFGSRITFKLIPSDGFGFNKRDGHYKIYIDKGMNPNEIKKFVFHEIIEIKLKEVLDGLDPHLVVDLITQHNFPGYRESLKEFVNNEINPIKNSINNINSYLDKQVELGDFFDSGYVELGLRLANLNTLIKIIKYKK